MYVENYKPLNNTICAYGDCKAKPSVRLGFALGFSALFCHKCAKILLNLKLAKELAVENLSQERDSKSHYNEEKTNATDRLSTPNSVALGHYTLEETKENDESWYV